MYLGSFCFRGELGFMNCDDICMGVVNAVDLKYKKISLTFTVGLVWCVYACDRP